MLEKKTFPLVFLVLFNKEKYKGERKRRGDEKEKTGRGREERKGGVRER